MSDPFDARVAVAHLGAISPEVCSLCGHEDVDIANHLFEPPPPRIGSVSSRWPRVHWAQIGSTSPGDPSPMRVPGRPAHADWLPTTRDFPGQRASWAQRRTTSLIPCRATHRLSLYLSTPGVIQQAFAQQEPSTGTIQAHDCAQVRSRHARVLARYPLPGFAAALPGVVVGNYIYHLCALLVVTVIVDVLHPKGIHHVNSLKGPLYY